MDREYRQLVFNTAYTFIEQWQWSEESNKERKEQVRERYIDEVYRARKFEG